MKYSLYLCFLLMALCSHQALGQTITYDNGKYGLMDESGKELLPNAYNLVHPIIIRKNKTSKFIYKLDGKFGLFDCESKENTRARFDSIEVKEQAIVILYANNLQGFLAESSPLKFELIEPQYQSIRINSNQNGYPYFFPTDYPWDNIRQYLNVNKEGLWGVVNHTNGSWVIKPNYREILKYDEENKLYYVRSSNSNENWIINPTNGKEFYFPYEVNTRLIDNQLHTVSKYKTNGEFIIHDFESGTEIFRYTSSHIKLAYRYITPQIIEITEEIHYSKQSNKITNYVLWFSLVSGREILYIPLKENEEISIEKQQDKKLVILREPYGNKRKLIGEIQGTFVVWKNKKFER